MEVFSEKHLGLSRSLEAALIMATKNVFKTKPRGTFRDILITEVSRKNCQIIGIASGLKCSYQPISGFESDTCGCGTFLSYPLGHIKCNNIDTKCLVVGSQ